MVPLVRLSESPLQYRRTYPDDPDFEDSIATKGVLQPVLAPPINGGPELQLVFGHCRFRAARKAELEQIPTIIREMSDLEVAEAQLVENCQRLDVHPLEEADALKSLLDVHKVAIEDLMVKVGKSRGYIYGRLKLCDLLEPGRKAFFAGTLNASVALMLARIPDAEAQKKATGEVLAGEDHWDNLGEHKTPWSVRKASAYLQEHYMLRLADAPFSKTAEDLVPAAGPCSTCPKRTGNQRELFDDVKSADVCTDPVCFDSKKAAHWKLEKEKAKEKGLEVVSKGITFHQGYGERKAAVDEHRSDFIDLDAVPASSGMRGTKTYRQILGKKLEDATVGIAKDTRGKVHQVLSKDEAKKLLKGTEVKVTEKYVRPTYGSQSLFPKEKAEQKEKENRRSAWRLLVWAAVVKAFEKKPIAHQLTKIALSLEDFVYSGDALERRGWKRGTLKTQAEKMTPAQLAGLCFELLENEGDNDDTRLKETAKEYAVDLEAIDDQLAPPKPAEEKPKPAKKAKAKAKKETKADIKATISGMCPVPNCPSKAGPGPLCPACSRTSTEEGLSDLKGIAAAKSCANCECTEAMACQGGCSWIDNARTPEGPAHVCTSCQDWLDEINRPSDGTLKDILKEPKAKKSAKAPKDSPAKEHLRKQLRPCIVPMCRYKATVGLDTASPMCQRHYSKWRRLVKSKEIGGGDGWEEPLTPEQLKLLSEDGRQKRGAA